MAASNLLAPALGPSGWGSPTRGPPTKCWLFLVYRPPSPPPAAAQASATLTPHAPRQLRPRMTVASPRAPAKAQAVGGAGAPPAQGKLFSFGLLSDVQHADIPDGFSFHGVPRFYREALRGLERAVAHFREAGVDFAVHLGDAIDFHNSITQPDAASGGLTKSEQALGGVLARFAALGRPSLHMLANHDLYNFPREELNSRMGINDYKDDPSSPHSYYAFVPHPGWRFLVLDGYEVSLLGWPPGHPLHEQAAAILAEKNPNQEKNSTVGLEGVARRFVKFGGGLSEGQLAWLGRQLAGARAVGERVVVCSHLCLHPKTCAGACLLWNYPEVLKLLQSHSDVVVATLAGHAHLDGYHQDEHGIHHRVCKAVLETPPGRDCFGVVDVYPDRLVVNGVDTFASGEWVIGGGSVVGRVHHQADGLAAGPQQAAAAAAGVAQQAGGGH